MRSVQNHTAYSFDAMQSTQKLRRCQLSSSIPTPVFMEASLDLSVGATLMPAETVLSDEHCLYVDVLRLSIQYTSQLVKVQFTVPGLAVQPVVPALDVVVGAH